MKYKYFLHIAVKPSSQSNEVFYLLYGVFKSMVSARKKALTLDPFDGRFLIVRSSWVIESYSDCVFFYFKNFEFIYKTCGFRPDLRSIGMLD